MSLYRQICCFFCYLRTFDNSRTSSFQNRSPLSLAWNPSIPSKPILMIIFRTLWWSPRLQISPSGLISLNGFSSEPLYSRNILEESLPFPFTKKPSSLKHDFHTFEPTLRSFLKFFFSTLICFDFSSVPQSLLWSIFLSKSQDIRSFSKLPLAWLQTLLSLSLCSSSNFLLRLKHSKSLASS